jgi:hypothetical protein
MTVKEFMQENPAAILPRRPAVPNWIPIERTDLFLAYHVYANINTRFDGL